MVFGKKKLKFIDRINHGSYLDSVCVSQEVDIKLIEAALAGKYLGRKVVFGKKSFLDLKSLISRSLTSPLQENLS